jgi:tryptophan synthase alpha chain
VSRLQAAFASRKALMPYLVVGDPDFDASVELASALIEAGADALELGVPFSDPLADGPVIQAAGQRSLAAGFRVADAFRAARLIRRRHPATALALMTYANPVVNRGADAFAAEAAASGADALIVPDLPLEEAGPFEEVCRRYGLDLILFVAPTSTDQRIGAVAAHAGGFVYCVSVAGVTGARQRLEDHLPHLVARIRRAAPHLPVAIGFGISTPDAAAAAARLADGVIVGSAVVAAHAEGGAAHAAALVRGMRGALDGIA